ncbi:chemotaxis protein CheB [Halodurantibacterium flavum]|uniref:histidine kinase n=1 Tax=Halodurantibacterium flavum TaxID=1382802 RepID=A0ABW4S671_9RHOB
MTEEARPDGAEAGPSDLVIFGVGASAGGLEAFQALLATLRPSDEFALILVQHLDPEHVSLLPEILSKRTRAPVVSIEDGMQVQAGHIYLIPPAFQLEIEDRTLRLVEFTDPRGMRRPIDKFFESLARAHGQQAAVVVLSGTGSDGSQGVRAIKEAGGLVFAQEPREARYDGMPRSAIATEAVDMVLPVGDMMPVLRDFHDRRRGIAPAIESDAEFLEKVVKNVRYRTGHDFSGYKHATILRRVSLRMSVLGLDEPSDYLRELVQNKREAERLYRDLLINVTCFFRDPEVFETLRTRLIPEILAGKGMDDELRVWVPGCATGQEAYSIAILIAEAMERTDIRPRVAIFGTDIDDEALDIARRGSYPNSIITEVPHNLLERYFTPTRHGYDVAGPLRDMVRFSSQSLIKDPPFSKLDLLSCRNLMIYFSQNLQELATRIFHYALRPGGYLIMGPSETPRAEDDSFREIAAGQRVYRRNSAPARPLDLPRAYRPSLLAMPEDAPETEAPRLAMPVNVANALLARHAPAFLIVGSGDEVQMVGPGAERFVKVPSGPVSLGLRKLILPALEPAVRRLLTGLTLGKGSHRQIEVADLGPDMPPRLLLSAEDIGEGERLVTFRPLTSDTPRDDDAEARIVIDEAYVGQLEDELEDARQTIRTTIEELETSNEELKSSNEEMMSMNEELQSANEELSTTNEELQNKVRELNEANADLANFTESTQIATVFLDDQFRLRNFTPEAVAYFRFVEQDRGRALEDIGARLDMAAVMEACRRVASTGISEERELSTLDGKAEVSVRFAPYRADGVGAGGVVFSVFDVTTVARYAQDLERATAEARARLEEIEELYTVSPTAMALIGSDLCYIRVNPHLAEIHGFTVEEHIGRHISDIVPELGEAAIRPVEKVLRTGEPILRQVVRGNTRAHPDSPRIWEVDWYPLRQGGKVSAVGMNVRDVTSHVDMQADLRRIMRELQHRVKNMLSNVIALVNRARRETGDPKVILETLDQRIRALAHTHNLLTAENWASTAIRDVLTPELLQIYGDERVILRGPDLRLNARGTLAVGMAIHELATNAAKYGAFSNSTGRVQVQWSRLDEGDGERLILRWREKDGPRIAPPEREGFGTQLIRSLITGTMGGTMRMEWEPEGLEAVLDLPWNAATEVDYDTEVDPLQPSPPLSGGRSDYRPGDG